MIQIIKSKKLNNKGESLAETLVSMLIAAMGMVVLAGALVSASKANKATLDVKPFTNAALTGSGTVEIELDGESDSIDVSVTKYEEDAEGRSVYFYESN